jgi:anti-anti-sigma regulatory factor
MSLFMNGAAARIAEGTSQLPSRVAVVVDTDHEPVQATVSSVQLEQDHALVVVRGAVCEVFLPTLRNHLANLAAAGVRYMVLDLAEVTACPAAIVGELAAACRELYARQGWLRSITTARCVAEALESADLDDLFPIYRAAGTEFRHAS